MTIIVVGEESFSTSLVPTVFQSGTHSLKEHDGDKSTDAHDFNSDVVFKGNVNLAADSWKTLEVYGIVSCNELSVLGNSAFAGQFNTFKGTIKPPALESLELQPTKIILSRSIELGTHKRYSYSKFRSHGGSQP